MGGLVARSACHYASSESKTWPSLVSHVFCLGSPHRGAPLEKFGNLLTRVLGAIDCRVHEFRLAPGRSQRWHQRPTRRARLDEDGIGRYSDALLQDGQREVPLAPSVSYHFVSATVTTDPDHPLGRIIGDLLVRCTEAARAAYALRDVRD